MRCVSPRSRLRQAAVAAEVRPSRPSVSGLSVSTGPLKHMRGPRRAESFARWESWFGRKRCRLELAQPHGSGLHKKFGFSLRQAAHGWLVASAVTALSVSSLAAASAREVIDSAGRKVQVPDRVERVVAAGPPASVLVVMLAPEKLVGWNLKPRESELAFLPPVVRKLPEIGRLTGRGGTANLEVVMAAKPDIILDFGSVNDTYVSLADRVQAQTGIPYILIGGRFDETVSALRTVGSIFGVAERAGQLGDRTETIFHEVERVVRSAPVAQRPHVYLARRANGLESGNRGSINTEIIERAGGVNVVDANREKVGWSMSHSNKSSNGIRIQSSPPTAISLIRRKSHQHGRTWKRSAATASSLVRACHTAGLMGRLRSIGFWAFGGLSACSFQTGSKVTFATNHEASTSCSTRSM